jgi:hypothetical protein
MVNRKGAGAFPDFPEKLLHLKTITVHFDFVVKMHLNSEAG